MLIHVFKGLIVGLLVAIPVGPVGLLCLELTVTRGRKAGLCCASSMVFADICSAVMMLLGFSMLYNVLMSHESLLKALSALIFAAIGIVIIISRNARSKRQLSGSAMLGVWISGFALSVSPATFALMLYLFPALELTQFLYVIPVAFGVALGSAFWCSLILGAGSFIRKCLGEKLLRFRTVVGVLFTLIGLSGAILALI